MENSYTLKSFQEYEENKRIFNKRYNFITKKYISRVRIGSCSYLFQKLAPKTAQEFMNKYIESAKGVPFDYNRLVGDTHAGRTIEQLEKLAFEYCREIGDENITVEMCFDDIINHTIIETFDGHQAELHIIKVLEDKGCIVKNEIDFFDADCNVDITIKDKETNKNIHYIQIKPISTFLGDNNPSLLSDRKNFFDKQDKLNGYLRYNEREDEIKEIEYMLYDKALYHQTGKFFFVCQNDRTRFSLNELCDKTTGKTKYNKYDFNLKEI